MGDSKCERAEIAPFFRELLSFDIHWKFPLGAAGAE
jgi:hypothetical protein